MDLIFPPRFPGSRSRAGRAIRAAALTLMYTSTLLSFAATSAPAPVTPPDFPDTTHVREGCFISSVAYLAKFAAEFPGEYGAPVSVHPRIYPTPHTVALVTWAGEWWLRDEFVGVFRLNLPVASREITESVRHRAEVALDRRVRGLSRQERESILSLGLHGNRAVDAAREVAAAANLIPFDGEHFRIVSGGREVPVLFFRPSPGRIAVYDANFGTASAATDIADSATIVRLVAEQLGYRAASVRPAVSLVKGEIIAAAGAFAGGRGR